MTIVSPGKATEAWNMELVGHSDLGGYGNCMHINFKDRFAFIAHMDGRGTSILDVVDPSSPRLVGHIPAPPNTHSHKVQIVDDLLVVNRERLPDKYGGRRDQSWTGGVELFDISDPMNPQPLALWRCGGRGVHRMTYWEPPYAYVAAADDDFLSEFLVVLDLSDPTHPKEVGRWWVEGQAIGRGETPTWNPEKRTVRLHHGIPRGDRLYCGWWDDGMRILDIGNPASPAQISHLDFGEASTKTHTVCPFPTRDIVVTTDECTTDGEMSPAQRVRVVDIADESAPRLLAEVPIPRGDFAGRGGRFGPHNLHEMRPGTFQDYSTAYVTYFNAGVRVIDISDPADPTEIAYFVPPEPDRAGLHDGPGPSPSAIQLNDLIVDEGGLIWVSDRAGGGLYVFKLNSSANAFRKTAAMRDR